MKKLEDNILALGTLGSVVVLIVIVALAIAYPLVIIWCLNTLFAPMLSIPYSFSTWLATFVLNWTAFGGIKYRLSTIKEKL